MPKNEFELDKKIKDINYYHIKLENYKTDNLVINDGVVVESWGTSVLDALEYYRRINRKVGMNIDLDLLKKWYDNKLSSETKVQLTCGIN